MNRRELLKMLVVTGAASFIEPTTLLGAPGETTDDPDHFLILYLVTGGLDSHYFFDPKSKKLTSSNLKQNYLPGDDAALMRPIQDARGEKSFCTPLVENLWKDHRDFFSVLKGVYMSGSFDGHENNLTMLLTGKALASPSFLPYLSESFVLEYIQSGFAKDLVTNAGGGANVSPQMVKNLIEKFKAVPSNATLGDKFIKDRFKNLGRAGLLASGAKKFLDGMERREAMASLLKGFETNEYNKIPPEISPLGQTDGPRQFLPVLKDMFRNRLTRVAILRDGSIPSVDAHGPPVAKALGALVYPPIVRNIDDLFTFLKKTPYDDKRTLADVCTVMVASEFNRTYRSLSSGAVDVNNTGTDHNTFSNFVMIGGKGIKKGLICGDTDLGDVGADNKFANVSEIHRQKDPALVKSLGLPFDFDTLMPTPFPVKGGSFKIENHLTYNSVINTVLQLFGTKSFRAKIEATDREAPVISKLLA